jgi:hypothetical protein
MLTESLSSKTNMLRKKKKKKKKKVIILKIKSYYLAKIIEENLQMTSSGVICPPSTAAITHSF